MFSKVVFCCENVGRQRDCANFWHFLTWNQPFFKLIEFLGLNKVNWVEKGLISCEKMSKICKITLSADVFTTKQNLGKHFTVEGFHWPIASVQHLHLHFIAPRQDMNCWKRIEFNSWGFANTKTAIETLRNKLWKIGFYKCKIGFYKCKTGFYKWKTGFYKWKTGFYKCTAWFYKCKTGFYKCKHDFTSVTGFHKCKTWFYKCKFGF